jgi:predicted porin
MKKSLIALAVLAASGAAMAQSSVTVFGVVDAAYSVGKGSTSNKTQLANSGYNSSRLGFRGVEDLGGGMRAEFWLEAGVNNDDGSGAGTNNNNQARPSTDPAINARNQGLTFNRKSTVGLVGSMGEIRLGRDYSPQFYADAVYDPFGTNGVASSLIAYNGGQAAVRASNMVAWHSPVVGGFKVMVGSYMGENASTAAKVGNGNGIYLNYTQGALSAGYSSAKTTTGAGTEVKTTGLGGSYNLGFANIMGESNTVSNTGAADLKGTLIGAHIPLAGGNFRISSAKLSQGAAETKRIAFGFVNPLSKRTDLYATYARNTNSGGANRGLNGAVTAANASSTGYDFGIKHSF